MTEDLIRACGILRENNCTLVLCRGDELYSSCERGIKPLIELMESGKSLIGYSAADKAVGKAAAFLYVLLGVKSVWAGILSEKAKEVFDRYSVEVSFDKLVPAVKNRSGKGFCPMEQAVEDINSPEEALIKIIKTLKSLK